MTALTLRTVFHLPLRQTEGFLASLIRLMGLALQTPDHATLSRRSWRKLHLALDGDRFMVAAELPAWKS